MRRLPLDGPTREHAMSTPERHTEPIDVHLILLRHGVEGPKVLLSRRAGQVYAAGLWHLPSGHLDGPHEDVVTALIREAREETGVIIHRDDVRAAVTVHHRSPHGGARIGLFFEVRRWQGSPQVMEPAVCDATSRRSAAALRRARTSMEPGWWVESVKATTASRAAA